MELERFVDLGEPLGPVGGAAPTAFIERQLELAEQTRHLFPRRDVAEVRLGAQSGLVDVVERGQAARKELAVDDALGEAVDRAEAEPDCPWLA